MGKLAGRARGRSEEISGYVALFPKRSLREQIDDALTQALLSAEARVNSGSVSPTLDFDTFRRELRALDFGAPRDIRDLLSWTVAQMERGIVHITHPRYFGLFNPAPTFAAQCADRIVAAFNPQLASSKTSPVAVEIEAHVIRAIAKRAGLPDESTGHFTSGGSEANCTALICALTKALPSFAKEGARAFDGAPTFYVSRESHLAWLKIAHQTGIGRSAVRLVGTDGSGRMDASELEKMVISDSAGGRIPVMIAATAGTSNAGMVDPLSSCADIAAAHRLWYHVDAAWGGALVVSDSLREVLKGIERADSMTIDAHKWFATTMGAGMFITRHGAVLSDAFQVSVSFMPSNVPGLDPYVTTMQWSRRFMGLRLFLSLASTGWDGYAAHIQKSLDLASLIETRLVSKGWRVANRSPVGVLCVIPPRGSEEVRAIVNRVVSSGRAWVAPALFESSDTVRICVTHGETTPEDVDALVEALVAASE